MTEGVLRGGEAVQLLDLGQICGAASPQVLARFLPFTGLTVIQLYRCIAIFIHSLECRGNICKNIIRAGKCQTASDPNSLAV